MINEFGAIGYSMKCRSVDLVLDGVNFANHVKVRV